MKYANFFLGFACWLLHSVAFNHIFFRTDALRLVTYLCMKMEAIPANTSTLNQRWNNIDRQRSSTLFQRLYLVGNESWVNVCLSTLFQRWQNNVETTLIELRPLNVNDSMLFKRRYLVENESWTNAYLPALFWLWYLLYWYSLSRGSITKLNYVFKHTVKHIFLL